MGQRVLIAFILFFEIGNSGCKVSDGAGDNNAFQYTITVVARDSEVAMPVVMDVFMKAQVLIVNMQQLYIAQQQVAYSITCKHVTTRKLDELREELIQKPGVLTVDVKRIL